MINWDGNASELRSSLNEMKTQIQNLNLLRKLVPPRDLRAARPISILLMPTRNQSKGGTVPKSSIQCRSRTKITIGTSSIIEAEELNERIKCRLPRVSLWVCLCAVLSVLKYHFANFLRTSVRVWVFRRVEHHSKT